MPIQAMVGKSKSFSGEGSSLDDGAGLQDVLQTIQKLRSRLQDEEDTLEPLNDILLNKTMQALIRVHEKVRPIEEHKTMQPVSGSSFPLLLEFQSSPEFHELLTLFDSCPHLRALVQCHDQIANKKFEPELPEAETCQSMMGDEEESMKVVRLVKGNEPLGATIAVDGLTGNIVIARILKGGAADRSGLIHVNDILVEVNKIPVCGKKPEDLIRLLADFRGPLTFRLIPGEAVIYPQEKNSEPLMYVRAKFDYNPERDRLIPCAEAGLRFRKNDVLCIVLRDDESWWQAAFVDEGIHARHMKSNDLGCSYYRVGTTGKVTSSTRAGIIPSAKLQTRRETLRRQATIRSDTNSAVKGSNSSLTKEKEKRQGKSAWSLLRQSFRKSNRSLELSSLSPGQGKPQETVFMGPETVIAYEEVILLSPASETPKECRYYRPIVLLGPQGVGRNELKDRLIDSNPSHYSVPVPHTSRPKLPEEEDRKDYYFVTREFMEHGIRENIFLEYGEYKGNLYGTSLEAVNAVTLNQQICVLTPYPQALKVLRNGKLKPFVIFIKPPVLEEISDELGNAVHHAKLTIDRDMSVPFSMEELRDLVCRGDKMENSFGHWFDYVIVNDGVDRAFMELKQVVFAVANEPQWVPKEWTDA